MSKEIVKTGIRILLPPILAFGLGFGADRGTNVPGKTGERNDDGHSLVVEPDLQKEECELEAPQIDVKKLPRITDIQGPFAVGPDNCFILERRKQNSQ